MKLNFRSAVGVLFGLCGVAVNGRAAERPAGIVEQPCAVVDAQLGDDWAGLCHYRAENLGIRQAGTVSVVFMGDSITEDWKKIHPDFFSDGYVDRGVSGQTTAQMLVRFRQDVIALKPAVVHIMAGTNDIAGNAGPTSFGAMRNNIISMVELAQVNDIRAVLASVPPAGTFPWRASIADPAPQIVEFNHWLRQFAQQRGLVYVDYHEALADERDAMKETFADDGVHPNATGYAVMEPIAREAIQQALGTAASRPKPPASHAHVHHKKEMTGRS